MGEEGARRGEGAGNQRFGTSELSISRYRKLNKSNTETKLPTRYAITTERIYKGIFRDTSEGESYSCSSVWTCVAKSGEILMKNDGCTFQIYISGQTVAMVNSMQQCGSLYTN